MMHGLANVKFIKKNHEKYQPLHILAPECHLRGVYKHKRWHSGVGIYRGDTYHELCTMICILLHFIKRMFWSRYWIC